MRAQLTEKRMQGLRGHLHLRAQSTQERTQGLQGHFYLRALPSQEQMQGLRGRLHLRPPPSEEQMQGLQATPARLSLPLTARSCDRMLGVQAHSPHDSSRTSTPGSCCRHRRSPLRPRSTQYTSNAVRCDWRLALLACTVCFLARTIPHTTEHTGTFSGAHTCARLQMSASASSHTQTTLLQHALGLARWCAHAHMHMHRVRQMASDARHTDGIS